MNEIKSIKLELKDLDSRARTAVIMHAHYDSIDKVKDVVKKGAFNRAWANTKDNLGFYFNHDSNQVPGKVVGVFEDNKGAYTRVKFGTHTLGNDMLIMLDEGTIKSASFGFYTVKSRQAEIKGQKVRELLELRHTETSVLSIEPCNDLAGVVEVNKSLYDRMQVLQKFVRNSTASDECIKSIQRQVEEINNILVLSNTATPQPSAEDGAIVVSGRFEEFRKKLKLINENF
jgi:HK97 family phage prohead protease